MNPYALLRSAQRDAPRVALTYAIAGVAGYLAMRLSVPLPWMMGALLACQSALNSFQVTAPKSFQLVRPVWAAFCAV